MPHPLQMFYGNLSQLGKKSNSVIRSRSVSISSKYSDEFNMYLKLFVLLYADDTVLMSDSPEDFFSMNTHVTGI